MSHRLFGPGLVAAVAFVSFAAARPASAQTITNFSFESSVAAGYTVPPGWTATGGGTIGGGSHGVGIDGSGGTFANNGVIPDGGQVAFLQTDGSAPTTLAQTITGLTAGDQYVISFYDNSRSGNTPTLNVSFGGQAIITPQTITSVGGANPYHFITGTAYTASSTSATLIFAASIPTGGDSTALIDNVTIRDISAPAVPEASTTVSFGLLLALGLGGVVVAAKRKKARAGS